MSRGALSPPKTPTLLPAGCPPAFQPFLLSCLEGGTLVVVALDGEGRITWSNPAFRHQVLEDRPERGLAFRDLLDAESALVLGHLKPFRPGEVKTLDLRHRISVGLMAISYQFIEGTDGCVFGIGVDRTEERELIEQMQALIDDLHREIARRTELSKRLEEMAITDSLTSLANRRRFDETLLQEWRRSRRYTTIPFALLLIDVDHFKDVNDRLGHQAGDEVLARIAAVLRTEVRAEDLVARYGGDEMAIIALGADGVRARDLADRLRQRVAAAPMPIGLPGITITIGVCSTGGSRPPESMEDLVSRADSALYLAKEKGRNRVELAADPGPGEAAGLPPA